MPNNFAKEYVSYRYTNTVTATMISGRGRSLSGGGGLIFIYSCSALLISFEIHCFQGM